MVLLDELTVADDPATWAALGFAVDGDVAQVGSVAIRLAGRPPDADRSASPRDPAHGIVGWTLRGIPAAAQLDGLPTTAAAGSPAAAGPPAAAAPALLAAGAPPAAAPHPNGVARLDHVVAITPALDRTIAALQAAGLDLRRVREEPTPAGAPRQAFFRLGEAILEVVQAPDEAIERSGGSDGPAFFWGLAFVAPDLDATVAHLGDRVSEIRPAIQPGRRIATLRRTAGLAMPVALMTL